MRREAKDYYKCAAGAYKENLLIGHVPIEVSCFSSHFLNHNVENNIKAVIRGTRWMLQQSSCF